MIGWAIETLVATTVLLVAVLALRGPVRRAFGSGMAYALWALPAARLIAPHLRGDWQLSRLLTPIAARAAAAPGLAVGVLDPATLSPDIARHATIATAAIGHHHAAIALVPPVTAAGGPNVATLLLAVWIAGGALLLAYHSIAHTLFCRRLLRSAAGGPTTAIGRVRVIESAAASTPLAFGILRPYVVFPRDFAARYDADERDLALLHELGHHRRGDLIANWAALVMLALHWFNPIAWRAFRAFRADQEMANDAAVLAGRSVVERHAYACAIVKAAHAGFGTVAPTCHLNTVEDLKGRLKMLTTGRRSRTRLALGAATIAGLTVAGLGLTASGTVAARTVHDEIAARARIAPGHFAAAPQEAPVAGDRHHVTVVKDGKRTDYDGAEAEAYVAAHPAMTPPTPPMPAMPAMAEQEAMPPSPPASPAVGPEAMRVIVRDRVGDIRATDFGAMPAMRDIPDVRSMDCPGSAQNREVVIRSHEGSTPKIVVCTNRVQRLAADAAARAGNGREMERRAYTKALAGLEATRERMLHKGDMADWERRNVLAAIDQSIEQMRGQLARMD